MKRKIIPCKVRDEYILGSGGVIGAEGSGGDVALELEFGEMWEGLVKYVTFRNALGEEPETVLVTADLMELREKPVRNRHCPPGPAPDGEVREPQVRAVYLVPVPAKAKAVAGEMSVTVRGFGVNEAGTQTEAALVAATAYFRVLPGKWALPETEGFTEPTVAQQMQAQIERIQRDIVDAAQAADAKEAARQSAAAAAEAVQEAQAAQTGAEEALEGARTAREGAQTAREGAETAWTEAHAAREGAETAWKRAETERLQTEIARNGAEDARSGAVAAKEGAQSYHSMAEAAKREAQAAMREAELSRGGAQAAKTEAQDASCRAADEALLAMSYSGEAREFSMYTKEQADRAKREADRAKAIAGGDFVTDPELAWAVADMATAPLVGPAELVGELRPGGVLFITDEGLPEDYAVTLEMLLAEGDKACAGQADALETLLTVGVARALGLRSDGEGSEYTMATLPSLAEDIRALCAAAQAGGSYVLDGRTAVSHRQVQYYILHKALASEAQTQGENWGWMADPRTEMGALRREMAQLRALVGAVEPGITQEAADQLYMLRNDINYLDEAGGVVIEDIGYGTRVGLDSVGAYIDFTEPSSNMISTIVGQVGFGLSYNNGYELWLTAEEGLVEQSERNYFLLRGNQKDTHLVLQNVLLEGVKTIIDGEDIFSYNTQKHYAASVEYVRNAIKAAVGEIGAILDEINGEVV